MVLAGWVNEEQQKINEFYRAQLEAVMKTQGKKRLLLTDDQRRILAVKGKSLGRKTLMELTRLVKKLRRTIRAFHDASCDTARRDLSADFGP